MYLYCFQKQAKFGNLKVDYIDLMTKRKLLEYLETHPHEEWSSAGVDSKYILCMA